MSIQKSVQLAGQKVLQCVAHGPVRAERELGMRSRGWFARHGPVSIPHIRRLIPKRRCRSRDLVLDNEPALERSASDGVHFNRTRFQAWESLAYGAGSSPFEYGHMSWSFLVDC